MTEKQYKTIFPDYVERSVSKNQAIRVGIAFAELINEKEPPFFGVPVPLSESDLHLFVNRSGAKDDENLADVRRECARSIFFGFDTLSTSSSVETTGFAFLNTLKTKPRENQ